MRIIPFIIPVILTAALIFALDNKWGGVPPLGKFLSPQQGFWQNAEAADHDFNEKLVFKTLKGKVNVYLDDRLVPHIFAEAGKRCLFCAGLFTCQVPALANGVSNHALRPDAFPKF